MKIWVIADDRTGNTHQAIALAEKLTDEYIIIRLEYNCLAKLPNFLLKYYPIHIKKEILQDIIVKPLPDVIITAGRRTAALAFYLKKKLSKEIKLVQIMQPALPYEAFESIILPYHDLGNMCHSHVGSDVIPAKAGIQKKVKLFEFLIKILKTFTLLKLLDSCFRRNDIGNGDNTKHKNILPINGAINNVTAKFAAAEAELPKYYPNLAEFIAVIIGGNNKKFNFNEDEVVLFSSLLKTIYANQKIPFFISFSRRTPDSVKSIIKNNMPASAIIYDPTVDIRHLSKLAYREEFVEDTSPRTAAYTLVREDASTGSTHKLPLEVEFGKMSTGFNPYIAMLAKAKYIISTADSISMCSEAASSGKPLYIFCPSNFNSSKHEIFIKQLVEQKIARIFDKSVTMLEEYNYKPLNEAERIAKIIKSLIK